MERRVDISFNSEEKEELHGIVIAWLKDGFTIPPYGKAIYSIIEKLEITQEEVHDYDIKPPKNMEEKGMERGGE